jgi:pimeloyl-ACP methyl ester carboxylesterase
MAEMVASVIEARFGRPVLVVGVGFGGEVGADLALANPDLVAGLVLVDADFWSRPSGIVSLERLPWAGRAATYTWETGGRFALDGWSPHCEEGGWCPTPDEIATRSLIISIEGTTQSLYEFRRTPEAASAPARLDEIEVPMAYVWSSDGEVTREDVDRIVDEAPGLAVVESRSFQAHLDDPGAIEEALGLIVG